jgi:DoxX-like family
MSMSSRGRRIAGWVLSGLLTALFGASAVAKLLGAAQVVELFQKWGLADQRLLIGIGELTSALLFLIPRTHSLGVLLLSVYMGGAIVTHMQHGESYVLPSLILVLIWVAGFLRHSELLQSFQTAPSHSVNQAA